MNEDVRRAATDAAMKAMGCMVIGSPAHGQRCMIPGHNDPWTDLGCPHAMKVADAVLAAVTGPLQAAVELDLLAQITEWFDRPAHGRRHVMRPRAVVPHVRTRKSWHTGRRRSFLSWLGRWW
jgi:hypothetical protein